MKKYMKPSNWQSFTLPTRLEHMKYLTYDTDTDRQLSMELWNATTGAPGLLQAHRPVAIPPPRPRGVHEYVFEQDGERYRRVDTGRVVSPREMRLYVSRVSNEANKRIRFETQQLLAGVILYLLWYQRVRSILKALYRSIWIVWLGGEMFYDDAQRALFYAMMLPYFEELDRIAQGMDYGSAPFDGRTVAQVGALGKSGNSIHQNIGLERAIRGGDRFGRRVLALNENHCHNSKHRLGCVELAARGWVPIREIVPIGDATCGGYCLCRIETAKEIPTNG